MLIEKLEGLVEAQVFEPVRVLAALQWPILIKLSFNLTMAKVWNSATDDLEMSDPASVEDPGINFQDCIQSLSLIEPKGLFSTECLNFDQMA